MEGASFGQQDTRPSHPHAISGYGLDGVSLYYWSMEYHPHYFRRPIEGATYVSKQLKLGDVRDLRPARKTAWPQIEGLEVYIRTTMENSDTPVYIFDDHNHAFFAWREALEEGRIERGAYLMHFDEHDDAVVPYDPLQIKIAGEFPSLQEAADLARNYDINAFIAPAIQMGIVNEFMWIDPNHQGITHAPARSAMGGGQVISHTHMGIDDLSANQYSSKPIIDIDLDYFAHIEPGSDREAKDIAMMRFYMAQAGVVSIATSPGYIDQERAIDLVRRLLAK